MNKLSFNEWKNSMSFLIDDEFDSNFLGSITPLTKFINQSCKQFMTANSLASFLDKNTEEFDALVKLKAFISVIGLSGERLKRVVSLIRYSFFKEEFKTEWNIKRISKTIINNSEFKSLLVDFFINARNSKVGKKIPLYYMRNFRLLNPDFIEDLSDYNYVERILNDNEIQGRYSNKVGEHIEITIRKKLNTYKKNINPNLAYDVQKEFPLLNKNIDFLIPNVNALTILIESSYNITTGSGQSKRADQLVKMYTTLMEHNANHRKNKILMLNYCDGFGWLGRQNDLHRIYDASDFVFNQQHLHILEHVLNKYYN